MTPKASIITSLETAHFELEKALIGLSTLPSVDVNRMRFAAHTLSNYLTVSAGTVSLLQLHLDDHPDRDVAIWLNGLQHATSLMSHIALELMNAAPPSAPDLVSERVNLSTLVRRSCDYHRGIAKRKDIAIAVEADLPSPFARADRVAVAAVLDNLLSNAIKFSPSGTTIRARIRREPDALVCSIADQGPGITLEDQEQLFKHGVRLSNVPTAGEPSTGFGLAVARELVEKLGGTIWCESEPGDGSIFSFRLPAYEEPSSE